MVMRKTQTAFTSKRMAKKAAKKVWSQEHKARVIKVGKKYDVFVDGVRQHKYNG